MFRSAKSRSNLCVESPELLPPKLSEFGHQPFTSREQVSLAHWLRDPAWPRGTLNIYALEGYLTVLLVWPVAIPPGAWLPPIWNERGWRVRPPIDTVQRYGEFLELILGFLRSIDQGLLQTTPVFVPGMRLQIGHDRLDVEERAQHWAQGFGLGLSQGAQTRAAPARSARDAVRTIAALAPRQSSSKGDTQRIDISLTQAVLALANTRSSRGPLGVLPKKTIAVKLPDRLPPPQQLADPSAECTHLDT